MTNRTLTEVCNVIFDDMSSIQLALPAEMAGLGVSSTSLLAIPPPLAQLLVRVTF